MRSPLASGTDIAVYGDISQTWLSTSTVTGLTSAAKGNCVQANVCTPVAIFFGTNRVSAGSSPRITFGSGRGNTLTLGVAIVTVPRSHGRGNIERPSYWRAGDLFTGYTQDRARHFVIPAGGVVVYASDEAFLADVRSNIAELSEFKDHAFVYVHGFNMDFDSAVYRAAQLAYDLGADVHGARVPFGSPFIFSWPSKGEASGYGADEDSARLAQDHLGKFLKLVASLNVRHVHLIAHSLGNQPLLRVLHQIASATLPDLHFSQIILAAPDVDKSEFEQLAKVVASIANRTTLYASASDKAMLIARQFRRGFTRAGDVPLDGPVVVTGVDTLDVTAVSTDFLSLNHSVYADGKVLLNDISLIFRTSGKPLDRMPILEKKLLSGQEYWRYPK